MHHGERGKYYALLTLVQSHHEYTIIYFSPQQIGDSAPDIALIFLNVLTIVTNEVIFTISQEQDVEGLAYIIILCITAMCYTGFFVATRIWSFYTVQKHRPIPKYLKLKQGSNLAVKISALIGGLCYLIGNNIQPIFALNTSTFECDNDCLNAVGDASTLLLVVASLLFSVNEIYGKKPMEVLLRSIVGKPPEQESDGGEEDDWPIWAKTAESIAFIRVFDSSFSTIASLPGNNDTSCPTHMVVTTWLMFGILLIIWAILLIVIYLPGAIDAWRKRNTKRIVVNFLVKFAILFSTALILLGSNLGPLGCLFNCNIYNQSFFTVDCDRNGFHATRITLLLLAIALLLPEAIYMLIRWIKLTKRERRQEFQDNRQRPHSEELKQKGGQDNPAALQKNTTTEI